MVVSDRIADWEVTEFGRNDNAENFAEDIVPNAIEYLDFYQNNWLKGRIAEMPEDLDVIEICLEKEIRYQENLINLGRWQIDRFGETHLIRINMSWHRNHERICE